MNIPGITSSPINLISPSQAFEDSAGSKISSPVGNSPKISQEGQAILELAKEFGIEDLNLSVEELRKLESLYNQADKLLGLDTLPPLSADQEKQLDQLDAQINKIFELANNAPLSQEQEDQLNKLFTQQEKILGIDKIQLSESDEKLLGKIEDQIEQLFANKVDFDVSENISNNSTEAERIISELDTILGYNQELSAEQEKQIGTLFDQIDKILQNNDTSLPSKEQETLLDKLFGQVDEIYQARSYDSLTTSEKEQVDKLLGQLEKSLV